MGVNLAKTLIEATGLPEDPVKRELDSLLSQHGKDAANLTLEELREVMADYLQSVFLELQNEKSA